VVAFPVKNFRVKLPAKVARAVLELSAFKSATSS